MPRIDPITAIASSLHSSPGAYALLLGSGVSTAAGVPTGWEVVQSLIRRVAAVRGVEPPEENLSRWYVDTFAEQPTYSDLVTALAPTEADRQALMKSLIEGESEEGLRNPTGAHRAVARLMKHGLIRVVVTTNFDRLLERACSDEGVSLTILSSPDDVLGALPLAHVGPLLIKVHGDYLDPRIRNTQVELDAYDEAVDRLLDQVFDEYGLIVCGWSGEHDKALARALSRSKNHRFATYWTFRGTPGDETQKLAKQRRSQLIEIVDADHFFGQIRDACEALADMEGHHALSVAAAVAVCKRELSGDPRAIPVHDRIRSEIARLHDLDLVASPKFEGGEPEHTTRLSRFEGETQMIAALVATSSYWGNEESDRWWFDDIGRFAAYPSVSGSTSLIELVRFPSLIIIWSAGLSSVAARRWELTGRLLSEPIVRDPYRGQYLPAAFLITPDLLHVRDSVLRIFRVLREIFVHHLALGKEAFVDAFERWQYLLTLVSLDRELNGELNGEPLMSGFSPLLRTDAILDPSALVGEWTLVGFGEPVTTLLEHGLFGGDRGRVETAAKEFQERFRENAKRQDWSLIPPNQAGNLPTGIHYPGHFHADIDRL